MTAPHHSEAADGGDPPIRIAAVALGRTPQDPLQAAVTLEAWAGRTQHEALPELERAEVTRTRVHPDPVRRRPQRTDITEFVALAVVLASAFFWIEPLEEIVGDRLRTVVSWALPLALGMDRGIRMRLLAVDERNALRRELPVLNALLLGSLAVAAAAGGVDAATVVCLGIVWGQAAIFVKRRWLPIYVVLMAATSMWFLFDRPPSAGLIAAASGVLAASTACALGTSGSRPMLEPWSLTGASVVIGIAAGVMIAADLDMWIGTDRPTAASVVFVSVTGWWAAVRLAALWEELPDRLQAIELSDRSAWSGFLAGPAIIDALLRLVVPTGAILAVYLVLGEHRTAGIVAAFAMLAVAMLCTALLTAARSWMPAAALFTAGAVVSTVVPPWWPGAPFLLGATVPAVGAGGAAYALLRHTTATYATRMMIR